MLDIEVICPYCGKKYIVNYNKIGWTEIDEPNGYDERDKKTSQRKGT